MRRCEIRKIEIASNDERCTKKAIFLVQVVGKDGGQVEMCWECSHEWLPKLAKRNTVLVSLITG